MKINDFYFIDDNENSKFCLELINDSDSKLDLYFLERYEPNIWDYDINKIKFKNENNRYFIDIKDIYKYVDVDNKNVWDIFFYDDFNNKRVKIEINKDKDYIANKKASFNFKYGRLDFSFYKNASNGLSTRINLIPIIDLSVQVIENRENEIVLYFSGIQNLSQGRVYIVRESLDYPKQFNSIIKIDNIKNGLCNFNKDLLKNYCQHANEKWKFVYKLYDKFYDFKSKENLANIEFKIDESFNAKIVSQSGILKIVISEGLNENYKKIRLAFIGSCFSRNVFRSIDFYNVDYKRFYECGPTIFHISLPSLMSKKINYNKNDLVGTRTRLLELYGNTNFKKDSFSILKEYKPDYIIFDNYSSVNNNLYETIDDCFIDNNFYIKDTPAFKNLAIKKIYKPYQKEFAEQYEKAIPEFKKEIEKIIPLKNLIVIQSQIAQKKFVDDKVLDWENLQYIKFKNFLQNKLDNYLIRIIPEARYVNMHNINKYISTKSPIIDFTSSHLNSEYYRDCLNEINKIVLQDLLKKQGE